MMKRFFLIPVLALLIALAGCTCSANGKVSTPTAKPTVSAAPVVTTQPTMSAAPTETAAPVMPTEPAGSPTAGTTAGN